VACGKVDHVNCSFAAVESAPRATCARCGSSGHDDTRCRNRSADYERRRRRKSMPEPSWRAESPPRGHRNRRLSGGRRY